MDRMSRLTGKEKYGRVNIRKDIKDESDENIFLYFFFKYFIGLVM